MVDFAPALKRAVQLPTFAVGAGEQEQTFFGADEQQLFRGSEH
jgi:hypothetical protein